MRNLLFITLLCFVTACSNKSNITNYSDYSIYLKEDWHKEQINRVEKEINFWQNRLERDPGSYINMMECARYATEFHQLTGQVDYLNRADSLFQASSVRLNNKNAELLFALTQSSIATHQFPKALAYCKLAAETDVDPYVLQLLLFDTYLELGEYQNASESLQKIKDQSSFDYLIRKAKWDDKHGRLDAAIHAMELALKSIEKKSKKLKLWTLSNLADMYGHAGRIKEAYNAYLNVLAMEPSNLHCLKGIAWIAFSHDGNTVAARKILQFIISQNDSPEYKLLLAEIADAEKNTAEKLLWISKFINQATEIRYSNMYSKYLVKVFSEELQNHDKALLIAEKELSNRLTPETWEWIAWIKFLQGKKTEALTLVEKYVYGYNYEPEALLHVALIFEANGKLNESRRLFSECLKSSFELGPVLTEKIKNKLKSI